MPLKCYSFCILLLSCLQHSRVYAQPRNTTFLGKTCYGGEYKKMPDNYSLLTTTQQSHLLDTTLCEYCPVGKFSRGDTKSMNGDYANVKCSWCGNHHYAVRHPDAHVTSACCTWCAACAFGKQSLSHLPCSVCPVGTTGYSDKSSGWRADNLRRCKTCDAPGWFRGCFNCPHGWVKGDDTAINCTECPAGKTADSGQTRCRHIGETCYSGEYKHVPANYSQLDRTRREDLLDLTPCERCPAGKISGGETMIAPRGIRGDYGNTECTWCRRGWYADDVFDVYIYTRDRQNWCSRCEFGKFNTGMEPCYLCPLGQTGANSNLKLVPGSDTYIGEAAIIAGRLVWTPGCHPCLDGQFKDDANATMCTKCPAGKIGTADRIGCVDCPVGTYNKDHRICSDCHWGKYAAKTGMAECLRCPLGSNAHGYGRTNCTLCDVGKASLATPSSTHSANQWISCETCINPYFSNAMGLSHCKQCDAGSITNTSEESGCTVCTFGKYQRRRWEQVCKPCEPHVNADWFAYNMPTAKNTCPDTVKSLEQTTGSDVDVSPEVMSMPSYTAGNDPGLEARTSASDTKSDPLIFSFLCVLFTNTMIRVGA